MELVRENLDFERGQDPKAAMDLGGINFEDQFRKFYDEWTKSIESLIGKTITADVTRHWMDENHMSKYEEGTQTLKIVRINSPSSNSSMGSGLPIQWKIYFNSETGDRYSMYLDQKIHIK